MHRVSQNSRPLENLFKFDLSPNIPILYVLYTRDQCPFIKHCWDTDQFLYTGNCITYVFMYGIYIPIDTEYKFTYSQTIFNSVTYYCFTIISDVGNWVSNLDAQLVM